MAGEDTTIARPYAEAVFKTAEANNKLDLWSDMLSLLASVVNDKAIKSLIGNPKFSQESLSELMLEIVGGRFDEQGNNLIRVLIENGRLEVAAEISSMFEILKNKANGQIDVHVVSAYAMKAAQKKELSEALEAKLGCKVTLTSEKDADLIGGVRIKAGDLVIDGSVQAQLQQLSHEFEI